MLRRAIPYVLIAAANLLLLNTLLAIWTDKLERLLHPGTRAFEFLKLLFLTLNSGIAMRIGVHFFRRNNITNTRLKLIGSSAIVLAVSAWPYLQYSSLIIGNRIVSGSLRDRAAAKHARTGTPNETVASRLTFEEYNEIARSTSFPVAPSGASEIAYKYWSEDFLPDYFFELQYLLPPAANADTFDIQRDGFRKTQSVVKENGLQHVIYEESVI